MTYVFQLINESTVRARAKRAGYAVRKSRARHSIDNHGEFMLVNAGSNWIVLGSRYDATLEDIDAFLDDTK
jgi:hypothetical protein